MFELEPFSHSSHGTTIGAPNSICRYIPNGNENMYLYKNLYKDAYGSFICNSLLWKEPNVYQLKNE